ALPCIEAGVGPQRNQVHLVGDQVGRLCGKLCDKGCCARVGRGFVFVEQCAEGVGADSSRLQHQAAATGSAATCKMKLSQLPERSSHEHVGANLAAVHATVASAT